MQVSGHTVLVTGGSSGIGLALAAKFVSTGNRVIITGRDTKKLQHAKATLPALETEIADMRDSDALRKLATTYPTVDVLINNAAVQFNYQLGDPRTDLQIIDNEIGINLTGPIELIAAFLPSLQQKHEAAIINISSGLGFVPKQTAPVYCGTKAGLHMFSKSLRWQLENTTVKVYEIVPSLVDTPMTQGRGSGKITPEQLVDEFWQAFQHDRYELGIGKTKLLLALNRFVPLLAERIMRYGL